MDINAMSYGFIFTVFGIILGSVFTGLAYRSICNNKENVWHAKYNLLKEYHAEQHREHRDHIALLNEVIRQVKIPPYIQCTIIKEESNAKD